MNMPTHIPLRVLPADDVQLRNDAAVLQDRFGRRFSYLRLSVTDVCNFRCNYCLPDGYQCTDTPVPLTLEEIGRIARTFAAMGTRKIRITGGEPSLRKDLPEIIRVLKSTPGIDTVALTTNGYRLTHQIESWVNAGLDQLNVSIDSLDPQQFRAITGHDKLQEILSGLDMARSLGLTRIKVNAVLLRGFNLTEFPQFLHWLKDTDVSLRFIELMQTGDNEEFFRAQHVSGDDIRARLLQAGWVQKARSADDGPAQEFSHAEYAGRIGLIMPYSKDFCSTCNRLRISAQGKLHLCLFGEEGFDLRPLLQNDDSVSLEMRIRELLRDKKATHFLEEGKTGAVRHFAMLGG
ncbi:GTP 3',8-cyclase MoaA [Thalassolituus sp. LLYu03]|uniref:GTP 3',8-cyclase MoaA n=1 Tax=Thalassolituus sp. LLYu03 TaxID=3421656 RepID=UPI003D281ADF